jgi:hypothetical protein
VGLDSYFQADWAHILASAGGLCPRAGWPPCGSAEDMEGQAQRLRAYREGYRASLMVVAQALGLGDDRGPFLGAEGQRAPSRGPDRGAERSLPLDRGAGR